MSDTMESTGRTVDEAIREALLRMGLRREEVDVTVIQEARAGFLGVGRRQAVVKVERKSDQRRGARGQRGAREDQAGRGERGPRAGERLDEPRDRRGGGRRQDRRRPDGGDQVRGGRSRRRDDASTPAAPPTPGVEDKPGKPERDGRERVMAGRRDDDRAEASDRGEDGGKGRRRRRPRRRRKPGAEVEGGAGGPVGDGRLFGDDLAAVAAPKVDEPAAPALPAAPPAPQVESGAPRVTESAAVTPATVHEPEEDPLAFLMEAPAEPTTPPRPEPRAVEAERPSRSAGGELASGMVAVHRAQPFGPADAAQPTAFLQRVATDLMVKSGFPCRVQVQDGEYQQVKMVVDDRSAAVLIGRYGNTVDAVEYLVEKVASKAAGERVRMNLDINNYRLRREDNLAQRVRNAAAEARNTGQPVALEPAAGRERRIAHLQIQELEDLTTYTDIGPDGKYVVICRPDQVPAQFRQREPSAGEETVDAEHSAD